MHEDPSSDASSRDDTQRRIDEAFHRAKLGLPLSDHQLRIVQFLDNGFGCHACPEPRRS